MTVDITGGRTLHSLLFDADADAVAALTGAMTSGALGRRLHDAVSHLSVPLGAAAVSRLAAGAAGLLHRDLDSVLTAGWAEHGALRAAAGRTLAAPDTEELVELATHTIQWEHHPYIDMLVGGEAVVTITLTLRCEVEVDGLVAAVRDGELTAVHAGTCRGTLLLAVDGVELVRRPVRLDLSAAPRTAQPVRPARGAIR